MAQSKFFGYSAEIMRQTKIKAPLTDASLFLSRRASMEEAISIPGTESVEEFIGASLECIHYVMIRSLFIGTIHLVKLLGWHFPSG